MSSNEYWPPSQGESRSPCPGLNTLANHSYIPHSGTKIAPIELLNAIKLVYNLSTPLAMVLVSAGYLTCGKFSWSLPIFFQTGSWLPHLRMPVAWTLDLADLAARGLTKIAHNASLVHPDGVASNAPDPELVVTLLKAASADGNVGLSLSAIAHIHAKRVRSLAPGYENDALRERIAVAECGLAWLAMQNRDKGVIEKDAVEAWFGEERLPSGWWDGRRSPRAIGLGEARRAAREVVELAEMYGHGVDGS